GYSAALYHLFNHAFFKALLFLSAGSVIHAVDTNNMREMGGLSAPMPVTSRVMLFGALALAGIPPFSGFFSKGDILSVTFDAGVWHPQLLRPTRHGVSPRRNPLVALRARGDVDGRRWTRHRPRMVDVRGPTGSSGTIREGPGCRLHSPDAYETLLDRRRVRRDRSDRHCRRRSRLRLVRPECRRRNRERRRPRGDAGG